MTLIVILIFSFPANAGFLSGPDKLDNVAEAKDFHFLVPNETYPQDARRIWSQAPSGVYVSVGTERGFMGASFSSQATHLLLLDKNPAVVIYNQLNTLFLKMSENRQDYLRLRNYAGQDDWIKAAKKAGLPEASFKRLGDPLVWHFWKDNVRDDHHFDRFHAPAAKASEEFANINYLHNDELFERIHKMAKEDRIDSEVIDLGRNSRGVQNIVQKLNQLGLKLSVLDLSNAWWDNYIQPRDREVLLQIFEKIADQKSILLMTSIVGKGAQTRDYTMMAYRGFTFEHLKSSYPSYSVFFRQQDPTDAWDDPKMNNVLYDKIGVKPTRAADCAQTLREILKNP